MTKPATRNDQAKIYHQQKRQSWALLGIVIIGVVIDIAIQDVQFLIAKGMAMGGVVAYIAQCAFTYTAYRTTGARHAKQIMLNMYLGQAIKWLLTIIGLALVFVLMPTVNAIAVLLGYFLMLLIHTVSMFYLNK